MYTVVMLPAQDNITSFEIEAYEKHIELNWTFPTGSQVGNFRIYRSINNADFEILHNSGSGLRRYSDWLPDLASDIQIRYFIRPVLAGNEGTSTDTLLAVTSLMDDDAFLDMVQKHTLRYFWEFGHPVSGMARERNTSGDIVTTGGTGFGIMAMIAGADRGFLDRDEVLHRMVKIVSFLQIADRFHGAFPHWMDGRTGKVIPFSTFDNGADLVETSFLIQGLLTARQYFDRDDPLEQALQQGINSIWEAVEWSWFARPGTGVLTWHWSPQYQWQINHPIRGFDECMITYILAIASPTYPVPATLYNTGWAGGNYSNQGIHFGYPIYCGPFAGGPMFFAHYSFLGFDPRYHKDQYCNYFIRNRNHALIQQAYCQANPLGHQGYSEESWGITASDDPWGYLAHDLTAARDNGTIAPTAALSSMPYAPEASMLALKYFYRELGDRLWGPFGFYDAFNLNENWFANSYLAIDQGPIVGMIENFRTGLLWDLFMSIEVIHTALEAIGFEEDLILSDKLESVVPGISFFPNPAMDVIYFKAGVSLDISYWEAIDTSGKRKKLETIENKLISGELIELDLSGMAAGHYALLIHLTDGKIIHYKLIKSNHRTN